MGINPTDLGQDFVKKGMRLITQQSADTLLKKAAKEKAAECSVDLWDPTTGPQEPSPDCND
jgi:hypothetical protein